MGDYVRFAGILGYTTPPSTTSTVTNNGVPGTGTSTTTTTGGSGPVTITLDTKSPYEVASAGASFSLPSTSISPLFTYPPYYRFSRFCLSS